MTYQIFKVKSDIPIKKYIKSIMSFIYNGIIMFIVVYLIKFIDINSIYKVIIQISIGVIIYFGLNIKYILNNIDMRFKK